MSRNTNPKDNSWARLAVKTLNDRFGEHCRSNSVEYYIASDVISKRIRIGIRDTNTEGHASVVFFIDPNDGSLFHAAGWRQATLPARFTPSSEAELTEFIENRKGRRMDYSLR